MKANWWDKSNYLLALLIFLVPTNLFFKFFQSSSLVHGLRVDYLIPKFYFSDIIIILFLLFNFNYKKIKFKFNLTINLLLIIFIIRQFFTFKPIASFYYLIKILEFILLSSVILKNKFNKKIILFGFLFTLSFQSLLGLYQFITQKSLFGYLFWGEVNFSHPITLAKANFWGVEKILPYGTTPHPNILAGVLVIFWLLATKIFLGEKYKNIYLKLFYLLASIFSLIALGLTLSVSAWISLILGIFILIKPKTKTKKYLIYLGLIIFGFTPLSLNLINNYFPNKLSIQRRVWLNKASIKIILNKPLLGIGLNNFTSRVEEFSTNTEIARFVQPAHHTGLLFLSEGGLISLLLFYLVLKNFKILKINNLFLILPLLGPLSLDHYLLTTQTGLLLLVIYFTLINQAKE